MSALSAACRGKTDSLGWGSWKPYIIHRSVCEATFLYDSPCRYTFICSDFFWFMVCKNGAVDSRGFWLLEVIHLRPSSCMLSLSHFPSIPNNCMWPDDGTLMAVQYSFQHHCDSSPGFETRLLLIFSCSASVRAGFETSNQHGSSQSKILQTCFAESILVGL